MYNMRLLDYFLLYFFVPMLSVVCVLIPSVHAAVYSYDKLHRLTSVTYETGQNVSYRYDAAGNLLSVKVQAEPEPLIQLSGQIQDEEGDPIVGAQVTLGGLTSTSNTTGHYGFSDVHLGDYSLTVTKTDYVTHSQSVTFTDAHLTPVINVTLSAEPLIQLTGQVQDEAGNPVAGAQVTLGALTTSSNAAGQYSFSDVSPGDHILTVSKTNYIAYTQTVTLTGDNLTPTINTSLQPISDFFLEGRIFDERSSWQGLANAQLVLSRNGTVIHTILSQAGGHYRFDNLRAGNYQLIASKEAYHSQSVDFVLDEAHASAQQDLTLSVSVDYSISGYVLDIQGQPIPDVSVSYLSSSASDYTYTNAQGFYSLTSLAPDDYTLRAYKHTYTFNDDPPVVVRVDADYPHLIQDLNLRPDGIYIQLNTAQATVVSGETQECLFSGYHYSDNVDSRTNWADINYGVRNLQTDTYIQLGQKGVEILPETSWQDSYEIPAHILSSLGQYQCEAKAWIYEDEFKYSAIFEVTDDSIDPPPVACDDQPGRLDVLYLVDISESMEWPFVGGGDKMSAAREALDALNIQLREDNAGHRSALITFSGGGSIEHAARIVQPFTDDLSLFGEMIEQLESDQGATATPLGLQKALTLLTAESDVQNRPVVVWVTDGLPNIDLQGIGPDPYSLSALSALRLHDEQGAFYSKDTVAQMGAYDASNGVYLGQVLADTMQMVEQLRSAFSNVLIYPIALPGDGTRDDSFSPDLLSYAAWHTQAGVFMPMDHSALHSAMQSLLSHSLCQTEPSADLSLSVQGSPQIFRDEQAAYQVQIHNRGPFTTESLSVDWPLPNSLQFEDSPAWAQCQAGLSCTPPQLAPGAYLQWDVLLKAFSVDSFVTQATVSAVTPEIEAQDNHANVAIEVLEPPTTICLSDSFNGTFQDWQDTTLGNAETGNWGIREGRLWISGNGENLWTNDHVHFIYQQANGDFRVEVDVVDVPVDQGGTYRKAALLVRGKMNAKQGRDKRIMIAYAPDYSGQGGALTFGYRHKAKKAGRFLANDVTGIHLPVRLAVERVGNTYTVYYSQDNGTTWVKPSGYKEGQVTLNMGDDIYMGMGVASYAYEPMDVEFDNFGLCQ